MVDCRSHTVAVDWAAFGSPGCWGNRSRAFPLSENGALAEAAVGGDPGQGEEIALSWFADLGYEVRHVEEIAPGEPAAERDACDQVVLLVRLPDAVQRLNPEIPTEARDEAIRKVLHPESPSLAGNNRKFHAMLRDGVEVEYRRRDESIAGDRVRLIDYDDPDNNDWLVVNQFTVVEAGHNRRAG